MKEKEKDEDILREAKKAFNALYEANKENHDQFRKNMKFSFNIAEGHWNEEDLADRDAKGRPHLSAHKLGKFVSQVVNAERGMPNKDQVVPVDDAGDKQIARIYNYLINHIEYQSCFDEIITETGELAVGGGFGFWRILTEYTDKGFDQEIRIKGIPNSLMVYLDPKGRKAFIREGLTEEEFNEKFPDYKNESSSFEGDEDYELWYEDKKIFIAEYFRKVAVTKTIAEVMTESGEKAVIELDDSNKDIEVLRTREVKSYKVEWYKISGHSILERGEWPGSEIPIVEVDGHRVQFEGKMYKKSLTQDANDMNRAYDYWLTSLTEKVALSPKAPFVLTPQMIRGHEKQWDTANKDLHPYLLINSMGQGVPQRAPAPEVGQGELTMLQICDNNIKDILGMYETSVGMQSNERSGKAIQARAARSELGTFHFPDNLRRARLKTKKMLIELIPKIYDNERVVRVIGRKEQITLNKRVFDNSLKTFKVINDLNVGQYDIRASNPMNPTIRQMASDGLREAMQYVPTHADILLPIYLSYTDFPGMEEAVQAIKARTAQMQQAKMAADAPLDINSLLGGAQ